MENSCWVSVVFFVIMYFLLKSSIQIPALVFEDSINLTYPDNRVIVLALHSSPAKFAYVLLYSPFLFGKELFSMQDKLVKKKETYILKQKIPFHNNTNWQKVFVIYHSLN